MTRRLLSRLKAAGLLWPAVILSTAGHGMLLFWLETEPPVVASNGLEQATLTVSMASRPAVAGHSDGDRSQESPVSESVSRLPASDKALPEPTEPQPPAESKPVVREQPPESVMQTAVTDRKETVRPESEPQSQVSAAAPAAAPVTRHTEVAAVAREAVQPAHPESVPAGSDAIRPRRDIALQVPPELSPVGEPLLFSDLPGLEEPPAADQPSPAPRFVMGQAHTPHPGYPRIARQRGWQGEVVIALSVAGGGEVLEARVHQSSGFAVLDRAALSTLEDWQLAAVEREDEELLVPVRFELR